MKQPIVYMLASKKNGTLYVGVTSNLVKRIYEHQNHLAESFTKKYDCTLLVFYEIHDDIKAAIEREKQIKSGSRDKKLRLIESMNPSWQDLYESII